MANKDLMKNYRMANTCLHCKYSIFLTYDDGFCNFDGTHKEEYDCYPFDNHEFFKWEREHSISDGMVCDDFEAIKFAGIS